ncbi:MAG: AmmeMemoRadiSam system radical SAM enzyme [Erysipelotrichaceae bacterium]|nr:AmmeMemoRadiSam system radical SAM enzyme [Erysipelotrichaceae bacterium]
MSEPCKVCWRHCCPPEGKYGICGARKTVNGEVVCDNYGRLTSIALDPIEKKPLQHFHPGSMILSVGSYGCSLHCPFCQNHDISMPDRDIRYREVSPEELADLADQLKDRGNIGVAYTYNEPLISYEYVRDCGRLIHERGMYNVLVSNGMASLEVLEEIRPYIDAMNIDLKSFKEDCYRDVLGGDLNMVRSFIAEAVKSAHVEITTLIIPGINDSEEEIRQMASWIASLDKGIPYHLSRFFPAYRMTDRPPTPVKTVYRLAEISGEYLDNVYTGNC